MSDGEHEDTEDRTFRTNTGVCRITDDRLELERTGWRGKLADVLVGDSVGRAIGWYLAAGVALVAWGLYDLVVVGTNLGWLPLSFGVVALVNVALSRDASAATEIPRDAIENVVPEPPTFPVRRGHFMVHFREDGEERRRVVMLPGAFSGGGDEFETALELLRSEGLVDPPEE